jgi:glycosidase
VNLLSRNILDYNKRLFAFFVDPNKDGDFDDGVDGFRLDHAMDNLDRKPALTDLFTRFWKPLLIHLKNLNPALKNVAEQSDWNNYGFSYFEKTGVDRVFGFGLQRAILSFDKQQLIKNADSILAKCPQGKEQIIFLENHDMDRLASLVPETSRQKLAAALLLLIGGIPSIYYGQEIGMQGKIGNWGNTDGNDIPRRAAFDWYASGNGKGMATWYEHTGGWWDNNLLIPNDGVSAEEQMNNDSSLFNYYKKLIYLRQSNPALANGSYKIAINDNDYIFSFFRKNNDSKVLVAANLSGELQTARFNYVNNNCTVLFGKIQSYNKTIQLNPYEVLVFEIK